MNSWKEGVAKKLSHLLSDRPSSPPLHDVHSSHSFCPLVPQELPIAEDGVSSPKRSTFSSVFLSIFPASCSAAAQPVPSSLKVLECLHLNHILKVGSPAAFVSKLGHSKMLQMASRKTIIFLQPILLKTLIMLLREALMLLSQFKDFLPQMILPIAFLTLWINLHLYQQICLPQVALQNSFLILWINLHFCQQICLSSCTLAFLTL
ncbi:hypothetical protein KSP40_PGU002499 [Platanthera guangdongensis]|uniref:Uncharacterized protein n=1 Tax=Platanthera guangdongensis TaxID=2320717 RepID=A0ABR2M3F8_9ASPA